MFKFLIIIFCIGFVYYYFFRSNKESDNAQNDYKDDKSKGGQMEQKTIEENIDKFLAEHHISEDLFSKKELQRNRVLYDLQDETDDLEFCKTFISNKK